jgi:hypothetical protein
MRIESFRNPKKNAAIIGLKTLRGFEHGLVKRSRKLKQEEER